MHLRSLIVCIALCGTASVPFAQASTVPPSTGVNAAGNPLSVGSVDPNYTIFSSPYGASNAIVTSPNPNWVTPPAGSEWISYGTANGPGQGYSTGVYDYRTTFTVSSGDAGSYTVSGMWAADDIGSIYLNGVLIASVAPDYFSLTPFSITGFTSGTNTLDFDVNNSGGGPTGLLVDVTSAAPTVTPEPSAFLLFGTGLAGVLTAVRRRWNAGTQS